VQVLKRLVGEGVPVRRLDAILGAFVAAMRGTAETWEIVEGVRRALLRDLPGNEAERRLLTLSPDLEALIGSCVRRRGGTSFLAVPTHEAPELRETVRADLAEGDDGRSALVVRQPGLRPFVRRLVELDFPDLPVIEAGELSRPFAPLEPVR
jgi:type III secretory pathway component EscV